MFSNITYNYSGKRALVTGGASGIGRGVAVALSAAGAEVFAVDVNKEGLECLAAEHPTIHRLCVDLRDWDSTRKAVEEVLPIDLVANVAGIVAFEQFIDATPESFDKAMDINAKGPLNICQIVAKDLIARKNPGAVVNISSQASVSPEKGLVSYSASKAALNLITKTMAAELGQHQIRVNCVLPTATAQKAMSKGIESSHASEFKHILERIPLGRVAEVRDIVGPVLYLLSDAASMIHGHLLLVDGGYTTS